MYLAESRVLKLYSLSFSGFPKLFWYIHLSTHSLSKLKRKWNALGFWVLVTSAEPLG